MWRHLTRGARALFRRRAAERDLEDEIDDYLAHAAEAYAAQGMTAHDAARSARLEVGGVSAVREQVRAHGWENVVTTVASDVRVAARRLRAQPGFTVVSAVTLAVGIGAATAIFSAVNPVLLRSLPYPHADRIVSIWDRGIVNSLGNNSFGSYGTYAAFGTFHELGIRARSFDAISVDKAWQPTLRGLAEPERLDGQLVSAEFLRVLGVAPALGRDFTSLDDRPGAPNVVIIGDGLWRSRFGGDPAIIGRPLVLDGRTYEVIGVMLASFENVLAPAGQVWAPLRYDMTQSRAWGHHLRLLARVKPTVSVDRAREELDGIASHPLEDLPRPQWAKLANGFTVNPLQDDITRGVKPALVAVAVAVMLLLVIASVNVANLQLARAVGRRGEFALRTALGASRGRLVRQLLTESLLLAGIGGVLGMAIAAAGVRVLVAIGPAELPRIGAIRVDPAVFLFALIVTTIAGVAFGIVPALHAARSDPQRALSDVSLRTVGGHQRARSALVVAEVVLALMLVVSSGLLLRSLERLLTVNPGFDPSHVLTMQVQLSGQPFNDDSAALRFFERALDEVRGLPGVRDAAFTSQLPLSGDYDVYGVHLDASPVQREGEDHGAFRYGVSPGYFETMGIALRRGRTFEPSDRAGSRLVAVLNESYARREYPGMDPIGQLIHIGDNDGPPFTVVGVVGDVRQESLALGASDAAYLPASQWRYPDRVMSLVVRTRVTPAR